MQVGLHKLGSNRQILLIDLLVFLMITYFVAIHLYNVQVNTYLGQLGPALLVTAVSLYLFSSFEVKINTSLSSLLSRNILAVLLALTILFVMIYVLGPGSGKDVYGRGVLAINMILFGGYLLITRFALFKYHRKRFPFQPWIYVGSEERYQALDNELKKLKTHKIQRQDKARLSGFFDSVSDTGIIMDEEVYADSDLATQLINLKFKGGKVISIDNFYQDYLEKIPLFHLKEHWFISSEGFGYINDSIRQRIKRTLDLALAIGTLPLSAPLILGCSILILVFDRQNPFFQQKRIGWHGREFSLYKLKTMRINSSISDGRWTDQNDKRITAIGKFLRRYRLDELPQLINVIRGQMSIVGPRPEQPEYTKMLAQKIQYYETRHSIKPGITGWAQVKFPYGASVADSSSKLEYDLYYIKNYSLLFDLTILIKTFYTILSGGGR